jgi:hypothetical protein
MRHLVETQIVKGTGQGICYSKNELGLAEFNRGWPISANGKLALNGNLGKMIARVERQSCRVLT